MDDEHHGWLKELAAVEQLWRASLILVSTLEEAFLRGGAREQACPLGGEAQNRWRCRYQSAVQRLRRAGIKTALDEQAGAETYVLLRSRWEPLIAALAPAMACRVDQIDAGSSVSSPPVEPPDVDAKPESQRAEQRGEHELAGVAQLMHVGDVPAAIAAPNNRSFAADMMSAVRLGVRVSRIKSRSWNMTSCLE